VASEVIDKSMTMKAATSRRTPKKFLKKHIIIEN
jgi:hypothetical protein